MHRTLMLAVSSAAFAWSGFAGAQAPAPAAPPKPGVLPAEVPQSSDSVLADDGGERRGAGLPSLARLLELAEKRAPETELGRAAIEASRSASIGARLLPLGNPQLQVIGERGNRGVTQDVMIDASVALPVEVFGQRSSRIAEANALVQLAQSSYGVASAAARAETVRSYGRLIVAMERIRVLKEVEASQRREAQIYRERLTAQDTTARDARLADLEVARIVVLLEEARADTEAALTALEQITGERYAVRAQRYLEPPDAAALVASATNADASPLLAESRAEQRYFVRVGERARAEGRPPMAVIVKGGRGDFAETRFGAGLAIAFPVFRSNQGERARAAAEVKRARVREAVRRRAIGSQLAGLVREIRQIRRARKLLNEAALPAATDAVRMSVELQRAGKGELLPVIISRRDETLLRLRRLELSDREWRALGDIVQLTGVNPR